MISPDILKLINYFSDFINGLVLFLTGLFFWRISTFKDGYYCVTNEPDYEKLSHKEAIDKYIKDRNFSGYKANYLRKKLNKKLKKEEDKAELEKMKKTDINEVSKIANTLIYIAKEGKTICFSELYQVALDKEWSWRIGTKCIGKILDIIGHCCAYDAKNKKAYKKIDDCFPFINGLTKEKYSYKINKGFWQPFWKKLLPIKSYEKQTEEKVKKFQQDIYKKIENMTPEEIDKFLEKLKIFEPTYEKLKKNNKT